MRSPAVSLVLLLATAASASAGAPHYTATLRFNGTFVAEELDQGRVIARVRSKATWTIRDPGLVVTSQRGALALFPSGYTEARLTLTQRGFRALCDTGRQSFSDRLTRRPTLAWFSMHRRRGMVDLGFGWNGESVDRRYRAARDSYCAEPASTDDAGGNDDEAGAAAMAGRFGVRLSIPASRLIAGRSFVRRRRVRRTLDDLVDGTGVRETLTGTYRLILSRR